MLRYPAYLLIVSSVFCFACNNNDDASHKLSTELITLCQKTCKETVQCEANDDVSAAEIEERVTECAVGCLLTDATIDDDKNFKHPDVCREALKERFSCQAEVACNPSPSQRCRDAAKKSQLDVLFENDACLPDDDDDTNGDGGDKGDDGKTDPPPTEKERIRAQCDADCATDFAAAECNDRDYAEPHWIEACSNICVEEATDWASLAHASNPAACKDGQLKGSECQQEVACLGSEDVSERCETFFEHEIDDLVSACLPD